MTKSMGQAAASRATLNEAIALINAGERGKAEAICRDAIQHNPEDVNMTALLGASLLKSGEMEEAEKFLRRTIKLAPSKPMDIETPLRELGPVDSSALAEAILAQEKDAWREELHRQKSYDVHKQTESIVMVFTELDDWPSITIKKEPGWNRLVDVAMPVVHDIIGRFYPAGGTIIRAMAAKLLAGGKITSHRNVHPSFHFGHRIHVPITTNPRVRFIIQGRPYRFQVGKAYEINNQKNHGVMNKGTEDRITFIFDYIPPEQLKRIQRREQPAAIG